LNKIQKINENLDFSHKNHGGEFLKDNLKSDEFLDFSININPFIDKGQFVAPITSAVNNIDQYPDSLSLKLKEKMISSFTKEKMYNVNNFIIGAGSTELITIFSDTFIKLDDSVIIILPTFSEYAWAIKKNRGNIIPFYRKEINNFKLTNQDISQIIQLIENNNNVKAIFCCNPNNPNGALDSYDSLEKLIKYTHKHEILIFIDEAFIQFISDDSGVSNLIHNCSNLFISRSFTKIYGIPGIRIGYGIAHENLIKKMINFQNLWPVSVIAQEIIINLLENKEILAKSRKNIENERNFIISELDKFEVIKIYPSDSNFLLINIQKTGLNAREFRSILLNHKIIVRDCSNYDGLNDYYIRIGLQKHLHNEKLIKLIKYILNNLENPQKSDKNAK